MPGKAIGISMLSGYAGTQSRTADAIIQNRIAKSNISFGHAVVLTNDNKWDNVVKGTTAAQIAGIAVREVVQANTFDPQSNPDYMAETPCDVMVRGNCTVKCQRGTPKSGDAVYVRVKANAAYQDAVVGGLEATTDAENTVQVTNIEWTTGVMDANGMTEITIKTRAKG
jgi:hypothetical protein